MRCPRVHYVKLPPRVFNKIEDGTLDKITRIDPERDICAGDSLCIMLFDPQREKTIRKIKRRVLEVENTAGDQVNVRLGEINDLLW